MFKRPSQRIAVALVLAVLIVLPVASGWFVQRAADRTLVASRRLAAASVEQEFRAHLDAAVLIGRAIRGTLEREGVPSQASYEALVDRLFDDQPPRGLLGLNVIERIARPVDGWVAERGIDADRVRLSDLPEPWVISRIAPRVGNEGAIGFDIRNNPAAAAAATLALETGGTAMTPPITLVQTGERGYAFYVHTTTRMFVSVVFAGDKMLEGDFEQLAHTVDVTLADVTGDRRLIAVRLVDIDGPTQHWEHRFETLGRTWELGFTQLASATPVSVRYAGLIAGLLVAVGAGLVSALLLGLAGSERAALTRADDAVRDLQGSVRKLEDAVAVKDSFLAVTSHELYTPLTVISGFVQMMRIGRIVPDSDIGRTALDRIYRNTTRLSGIVDEMMITVRSRAGTLIATTTLVKLLPVVTEAVSDVGLGPVQVDVDEDVVVVADPAHVRRILINLLSNAMKHGAQPVSVQATSDGTTVTMVVADGGDGVASEDRDRLFDEFTQVDMSTTRTAGGLGMGLSIVRTLAEINGGSVDYVSAATGGAVFEVHLPSG